MSKIKAGQVHTATAQVIGVHLENATERGNFHVHLGESRLEISQARHLSELLATAADKAEILDAAVAA